MPGGVPWSAYLKMLSSSLLAMCAGAQMVHWYYRPDLVSAVGLVPILGVTAQRSVQFALFLLTFRLFPVFG